jgi:Na+/glutamate symporter
MTNKSGLTGLALGVAAATVGLLYGGPMGPGLAVAGVAALGMTSLKKAKDDLLAARREGALSDMYFLWKAHKH